MLVVIHLLLGLLGMHFASQIWLDDPQTKPSMPYNVVSSVLIIT